jgi:serine/threonine protein kinase
MKQCANCLRIISTKTEKCIYCETKTDTEIVLNKKSSISSNYRIHSGEIIIDGKSYDIVCPLGKGGFGTVLKVKSNSNKKHYALKVPLMFEMTSTNSNAHDDDVLKKSSEYIENEIQTIERFEGENFIFVYGKGTATAFFRGEEIKYPVYLMELAVTTLDELLRLSGEKSIILPFDEKKKIARDTVNAISHLHDLNVVHRDLSPDNIFLVDRAGKVNYVLGDFGASKRLYDVTNSAKSTRIIGHSEYLDPERFSNKDYRYDFKIDIYGLAVILCEVFAGTTWKSLFEDDVNIHSLDFEKDILIPKLSPLFELEGLTNVFAKAVTRNPADRYKNIYEFRDTLFKVLGINREENSAAPLNSSLSDDLTVFKNVEIQFNIPLPFLEEENTLLHENVVYNGKPIILKNYRGIRIDFSNFNPKSVTIENTEFYNASISNNAVMLSFKNRKFKKALEDFKDILTKARGILTFSAIIKLEGLRNK